MISINPTKPELDFIVQYYGKYPKTKQNLIDLRQFLGCLTNFGDFERHEKKEIIQSLLKKVRDATNWKPINPI
jgi:hypothetical protein